MKVRYDQQHERLHNSDLVWRESLPNRLNCDDGGAVWTPWVLLSDVSRVMRLRHTFDDLKATAMSAVRRGTARYQVVEVPSIECLPWIFIRGQLKESAAPHFEEQGFEDVVGEEEEEEEHAPDEEEETEAGCVCEVVACCDGSVWAHVVGVSS